MAILFAKETAWTWSGKVIAVADGDTITVLYDKRAERIRLYGIDCPEKKQPFGTRAKKFTSRMAFGKTVEVEPVARDRWGRIVAVVRIDNVYLNRKLVEEGFAWVYLRYCRSPRCLEWQELQLQAQQERCGLWSHSHPVPPWAFRRQRREK